ncbi:flagellar hook-length control protein FliK [Clostridium cochlearium]|uniref:flagellar hook-length control protein FliK n=1 Tax=Clostridium cochlearium TaxID=1494 RepID=UPI001EE0BDDF|nr:flagellar hook-length control protein FliK [Clostridium cochlearium]MCG4570645.1 flagellar hook-length control protein FliK [Clostridium cochlearium]
MIKSVNEIAFNKETNIKPRETKSNKGFDKFIKKFSQNKKGDGYLKSAKENTSHVEDKRGDGYLKSTKENTSQVENKTTLDEKDVDMEVSKLEDTDIEDSIKNTNEQLYLLIQNIFFQNIPEDIEGLLKEGNELSKTIEELVLNIVEDISKEENVDLNGINIKDLGLEEKVNKEEFKALFKNPETEEETLKEIKSQISSLIKEEILPKEDANVKKDFNNTVVPKENLNVKVETKKENLTQNSAEESFSKEENSEEAVLKNILGDKEDNKFSKAVNFMNQFNKVANVENLETENLENIVATKETLKTDVIKAVKYMELNNIKNLTVKINPKELGELVIRITMESGKMKANITANNKEAFNLLNANLQDITDKLQKGAIKIENFSLNLYEDTTFFSNDKEKGKEGFKGNKKNSTKVNAIENDIIENENPKEDLSNISILA